MKNPAMAIFLGGACLLMASCRSIGQAATPDETVKQWLACVTSTQTNIQAAVALMSFPFNWDGKMLSRDETEKKLQDFRKQITSLGITVTWYDWRILPRDEFTKIIASSKHASKYQKSEVHIDVMVLVLSKAVMGQPAFENVDGNFFGISREGKMIAWFN